MNNISEIKHGGKRKNSGRKGMKERTNLAIACEKSDKDKIQLNAENLGMTIKEFVLSRCLA